MGERRIRQARHISPRPHAGYFGVSSKSAPEVETRWRSEVNSNCKYRFSKLSYDSIMLGFVIETGCEALLPDTAFLARFSFCRWKRRYQDGAASLWNPAAESVAVWRMPEKASLERCDSSAEPALFRTIKAIRLSVANYNTTLWSESLETGTGSSNSLRSANESSGFRIL